MQHTATMQSPVGWLNLTADDEALTVLHMDDEPTVADDPNDVLDRAVAELTAYFAGELTEFTVPCRGEGTEFQRKVWQRLRDIPYGRTWTYGRLADSIGQPTASRAVGLANGRNPIAIIVPCHRVIGANGALTGYAGGIERKKTLLDLEKHASTPALF